VEAGASGVLDVGGDVGGGCVGEVLMTFRHTTGSILDSGADALVNPVNCVGVSGKGLALEFKKRFPTATDWYRKMAEDGLVDIGTSFHFYGINHPTVTRVFFLPTKMHWREPSHLSYVEAGLDALAESVNSCDDPCAGVRKIAIPALGCGLGGLDWEQVRPLIEQAAMQMKPEVLIYGPQ
jgi:O-acetyl-ADP-ribose deacetylase (regulator of RNase III)